MEPLLPLFPLGTVALPGMVVPLHVFEDRYRAMVGDLLSLPDRASRVFGVVAIREGYEVGAHETRSMYRTGCLMRLVSAERLDDGRFDVICAGQARFRVIGTDTERPYLRAQTTVLDEPLGADADQVTTAAMRALRTFEGYRAAVAELQGGEVTDLALPSGLTALSYALGAEASLPLSERQQLLEAATTVDRLRLVRRQLAAEVRAMRAVPSLPATDIARSRWSPN